MMHLGVKYAVKDFILIGWQDDDLPLFGKIQTIAVLGKEALFITTSYPTHAISHHYHCYVVRKTDEVCAIWLDELQANTVFQCHLRDCQLFITFRYHIEHLS